jgi:hypothetical protein
MQRINRLLLMARKQAHGDAFVHYGMLDREGDEYKLTIDLWDGVDGSARDREDWRLQYTFDTYEEAKAKWEEAQRQYGTNKKFEPVLLIFCGRE